MSALAIWRQLANCYAANAGDPVLRDLRDSVCLKDQHYFRVEDNLSTEELVEGIDVPV